jgi:hypothetical protein
MNRWRLEKAGLCLVLVCLVAGGATAQERDPGLEQYVGTKPDAHFFALPAVHDPLAALMGDRLDAFLRRFQVVRPIDKVARDIVAEGCVRNQCTSEQAAFAIDLDSGQVAAASLNHGRYIDIYSKSTTSYPDLPPGMRRWISSRTSQSGKFRRMKFRFFR